VKIAVHIARTILALVFAVFGLNSFFGFLPAVLPGGLAGQFLDALLRSRFMLYVGIVMLGGAVLLLVNRFVALGLCLLAPILANILIFHLTMAPKQIGMGVLLTIIWLFLFWWHHPAFAGMFEARTADS
jgi:putative oxidoreductase